MVRLLLGRQDVGLDTPDDGSCCPPILWAADNYIDIGKDDAITRLIQDLKALLAPPIYPKEI